MPEYFASTCHVDGIKIIGGCSLQQVLLRGTANHMLVLPVRAPGALLGIGPRNESHALVWRAELTLPNRGAQHLKAVVPGKTEKRRQWQRNYGLRAWHKREYSHRARTVPGTPSKSVRIVIIGLAPICSCGHEPVKHC